MTMTTQPSTAVPAEAGVWDLDAAGGPVLRSTWTKATCAVERASRLAGSAAQRAEAVVEQVEKRECQRLELSDPDLRTAASDHIRASSVLTQTGLPGVERRLADYSLTRFGAYMVAMNGDPRKPEVAAAQSYFAIKTREAEAGLQLDIANRDHLSLILTAGNAALIRAIEAEAKVAELEPAAEAWSALAEASGDYSLREAGEVLSRDPRIDTGQNKLMRYLREIGWVDRKGMVYQAQINTGRLAVRTRTYDDPYTGDPKLTTQIRVTAKGIDALRKMMTDPPVGLRALPGGAA